MRTTGKSEITEPRLSRRSVLLTGMAAAAALGGAVPMAAMAAQATATPKTLPNMPQRNPWLTDSVYPTTHFNPAATDSVAQAGPTKGRKLSTADVKVLPTVFTCSPTLKKVGDATIIIASGCEGVRKINGSGEAFELVSFLPYPGLEALAEKATPQAIEALLDEADAAARAKDDAKIIALSQKLSDLGFNRETALNGTYNLIDKDGFHYAAYGGMKILKSTDDNDPKAPLRVERSKDFASELPADLAKGQITTLGMTYDGHLAVAAQGGMFLLDRDLNLMGTLLFPGEAVENSICFDETATYCVTSRRMLKIVWTGTKLSTDEADGGWASEYNIATREQAIAMGSLTQSGGSGTTPTLMGFGDDPDKLVIISDGDPTGTHAVAFWRDKIPDDFRQRPGTKSRRIADQIQIDISKATIEPSPNVLGYGALYLNCLYPKPVPGEIWGNAMTAGLTRPAPTGAQRLNWNPREHRWEKSWINREIDNTDVVVPVVSAATGWIYFATKTKGNYEYIALDWMTGEEMARWPFPDDSRKWNVYGSGNIVLEDGDFLLGGFFTLKRVNIGDGVATGQ